MPRNGPSVIDPKAKGARRRRMTAVFERRGYINGPNGTKVNYTTPGGLGPADLVKSKGKVVSKRKQESARMNEAFMANASRNGFPARKKSRRPSRRQSGRR